jgi:hypothetical protein
MTHPDDGTLLALLDGELTADQQTSLDGHLGTCRSCARRRAELEAEFAMIGKALAAIDVEPPLAAARRAVEERRARRSTSVAAAGRRFWGSNLARAAGLLLAFAAVASAALPGSPVRNWLGSIRSVGVEEPTPAVSPEPTGSVAEPSVPQEVGIQLVESGGPLTVSIRGLGEGGELVVHLVEGAGSGIYAEEGTRFQSGPGQVVVHVAGAWVRIELSRALDTAAIEVDGTPYLLKDGERLELAGPNADSTEAEIRFRVPSEAP